MKNLIRKSTQLLTTLFAVAVIVTPATALAGGTPGGATGGGSTSASKDAACQGVELTGGSCSGNADVEVNGILTTVINIFSLIVGVVAVIMVILGGLRYITSGGDSSNTKAARDTILYAVIGLVIVALAQVIVRFVLKQV